MYFLIYVQFLGKYISWRTAPPLQGPLGTRSVILMQPKVNLGGIQHRWGMGHLQVSITLTTGRFRQILSVDPNHFSCSIRIWNQNFKWLRFALRIIDPGAYFQVKNKNFLLILQTRPPLIQVLIQIDSRQTCLQE